MDIERIQLDEDGSLDDFVFKSRGVYVHFEAMDQSQWWMMIEDEESGKAWRINCGAVNDRAKGYCWIYEEG